MSERPDARGVAAAGDPWSHADGWSWLSRYARTHLEGAEVARAFVLSVLLAEISGMLVLAVRAAELDAPAARARAWREVERLAPLVRHSLAAAGAAAVPGTSAATRRSAALLERLLDLAHEAPRAATGSGSLLSGPAPPMPAATAATLRQWLRAGGAQPSLDILAATALALPVLARECGAWSADLVDAWEALG